MSPDTTTVHRELGIEGMDIVHATYRKVTFPRHYHEMIAIAVMVEGNQRVTYQGHSEPVQAGSLIAFNPGDVHANSLLESDGWTCFSLYMSPTALAHLLNDDGVERHQAPIFRTPVIEDHSVFQSFMHLHHAVTAPSLRLAKESLLFTAVERLANRYTGFSRPRSQPDLGPRTISHIRDYLDAHYVENVSLSEIAQVANMRPSSLNRAFRRQLGLPPHAYLINRRVARACSLLDQGQSLVDVALSTGFYDQSHLNRHFRRIMGLTPAQYQRQPSA